MSAAQAKGMQFFEIGGEPKTSEAFYRATANAVDGSDQHGGMMRRIHDGSWRQNASQHPRPTGRRFERLLDIVAVPGDNFYAVHLDARDEQGRQRLAFVRDSPVVQIPLGVPGLDGILQQVECHDCTDGTPRWATFRLDTGRVPHVADEPSGDALDHGRHPSKIRIPFYFNVIDPVLGVPPWIFEEHADAGHEHDHAKHLDSILTHGGVHPPLVSYVGVEL